MSNKNKIIAAALQLFAQNGYAETSIAKIAELANVSKGLTYNHFQNKEDLLAVTIEQTIIKLTSEMMDDKEPCIESLFEAYFDSLRRNTQVIRLCLLLVVHPQTPAKVVSLLEAQKNELLELLCYLLQDQFGEDSYSEAEILLATLDGYTIKFTKDPNLEHLENTKHYLIKKYVK